MTTDHMKTIMAELEEAKLTIESKESFLDRLSNENDDLTWQIESLKQGIDD